MNNINPSMQKIFLDDLVSADKFFFVAREHGSDWAFRWALSDVGFCDEAVCVLVADYSIKEDDHPDVVYSCLLAETALAEYATSNN